MKKRAAPKSKKKAAEPEVLDADPAIEAEDLGEEGKFLPAVQKHPLPPSVPTDDPLALYLREIHKVPLLNLAEEQELARKAYDEKDPASVKRLVQSNLRFVVKIAFEYARFGHKVLDLIQE